MSFSSSEVRLISNLHRLICENQSGASQYWFQANEKHKAIKDLVREGLECFSEEEIVGRMDSLESYLYDTFYENFKESLGIFLELFESRCSREVRCSLKVTVDEKLETLFRYPESSLGYSESSPDYRAFKVIDNSAFESIVGGKRYYLTNNIPQDIESGVYVNPRISRDKVTAYLKEIQKDGGIGLPQDESDRLWLECWDQDSPKRSISVESCYRSTLVVPMSIETRKMSESFSEHFNIEITSGNVPERCIFGFVCFDHPDVGFFQEDSDVDLAYIFSDIMSLYLICQLSCTHHSSTYNEVSKYL
jgi:hypothetical protein